MVIMMLPASGRVAASSDHDEILITTLMSILPSLLLVWDGCSLSALSSPLALLTLAHSCRTLPS